MKIVDLKCLNCGSTLRKKEQDILICSSCHSEFLIDDETPDYITINHYHQTQQPHIKTSTRQSNKLLAAALFVMIIPIFIIFSLVLPGVKTNHTSVENMVKPRNTPESEGGKKLVSAIFHKPFEDVTTDELHSIKYIEVMSGDIANKKSWDFRYSLEEWKDGKSNYPISEFSIDQNITLDALDFSSFKGLNYLDFHDSYDIGGSSDNFTLKGLDELVFYGHTFNQPLKVILDSLENKENLTHLRTQLRNDNEVELLNSLPNLQFLDMTYVAEEVTSKSLLKLNNLTSLGYRNYAKADINWMSNLVNLKKLSIDSADKIPDFSVLYSLTNLESLKIENADLLKDINFINNMPKLKQLELINTSVKDIDPLKNKESLNNLTLKRNEISNIEALNTLNNLTELTLLGIKGESSTSLNNFGHLEKVAIDSSSLDVISQLKTITTLIIDGGSEIDLTKLDSFQKLDSLSLNSVDFTNEESLINLPLLKKVSLKEASNNSNYDTGTSLFEINTLEELNLGEKVSLYLNKDRAFSLPNLKKMTITEPSYLYMKIDDDYENITFKDGLYFTQKLKQAPQLEVLVLPKMELNSLDFTKDLKQLTYLDVRENYITDIEPLTQLPNLVDVNLFNNPVANIDILNNKINAMK
ncbi:leucine-rich repeat domain-containing protein [Vagococcus fluvialis]|uniref:Leucine-rich repeat domain-containing protein n=1 Tax=Vagococcus fluvialis TaxID=2738 RepID=A0A7X6I3L9_9ENTE|nr:leucine-rich repeat domain-containing protein [Vagococcus fluvialis]NKC68335.1 leucine-rich repeat domain-containing protein [Vagococcus fluvialis]